MPMVTKHLDTKKKFHKISKTLSDTSRKWFQHRLLHKILSCGHSSFLRKLVDSLTGANCKNSVAFVLNVLPKVTVKNAYILSSEKKKKYQNIVTKHLDTKTCFRKFHKLLLIQVGNGFSTDCYTKYCLLDILRFCKSL